MLVGELVIAPFLIGDNMDAIYVLIFIFGMSWATKKFLEYMKARAFKQR